jgi:histidinol-phosphate/aromatic aminotransferase/cobyric acid decarboxylase-like protein
VSFPLADWILGHPDVPHNLAISGMRDSLPTVAAALREHPAPRAEPLRASLGRIHGVEGGRVFLAHGATEANALALLYLERAIRKRRGRAARIWLPTPEYPPLRDASQALGFRSTREPRAADALALSSPRNPLGTRVPRSEIRALAELGRPLLLDRTFREFTPDPPESREHRPRLWLVGSFTKIYGADELRAGYVIPPPEEADGFGRLHGLLLDQLPHRTLAGCRAILAHRRAILTEARTLFRRNEAVLRAALPGIPPLAAPVCLDTAGGRIDGDRFQAALLRAGVLVSSGSFFGAPRGVRICLTRRSFPRDLAAYLRVRARFV